MEIFMDANLLERLSAKNSMRLLAGMILCFSTAAACAEPLSLQNAQAIALRQNPGLGALTQKIVELKHQAVSVA
ncbi:TolC family protein, partial [Acidithiobacillus thiooxidans]|nr:TolC family protein [Acidithiobacillus thiooxidans]